jgi:hypothetical protein
MVTPFEPVRFPLAVLMLMLVAPETDQLKTLLSPLVMVAGVAVKLAICGTCSEPKPEGLPAVPHPQFTASSRHAKRVHIACPIKALVLPNLMQKEMGFLTYMSFMSYLAPKKNVFFSRPL